MQLAKPAPLVVLLVLLSQSALQVFPAGAAEPDIWNIPAPAIVFQIEKAPRCKGCPSFVFTIYSDKTYHWEGREAVFFFGEGGDHKRWEAYRLADPASERRPGDAAALRRHYLKGVQGPALPVPWVSQFMDAVAESGLFEVPPGNKSAVSDAETRMWTRIEANWKGRHRAVELADHTIPQRLQAALSKFLGDALIRSSHPTPPFWADEEAVLWVSDGGRRCENTTGLILYTSGKAVMFGWNHLARDDAFQTVSAQIDRSVLQEIFAGFDQGKVDSYAGDPHYQWRTYQSHRVDQGLLAGNTRHVLIYKPNPNAFLGIPAITWGKLRDVRDKMKAQLRGPNDPERVEHCQKNRPR